jgi:hypothetical protein
MNDFIKNQVAKASADESAAVADRIDATIRYSHQAQTRRKRDVYRKRDPDLADSNQQPPG